MGSGLGSLSYAFRWYVLICLELMSCAMPGIMSGVISGASGAKSGVMSGVMWQFEGTCHIVSTRPTRSSLVSTSRSSSW